MNQRLDTNYFTIPFFLIVLIGVGFFIVRDIIRTHGTLKQRILRWCTGFLAFIGALTVFTIVYASSNQVFRGTLQMYVLTHLPEFQHDPEFNNGQTGYSNVFASFAVSDDGEKRVIFPKNKPEKFMQFYAPGNVKFGTVTDGVVVIDRTSTMPTSFWWLLTKNPYAITSSVRNAEEQLP